MQEGESPEGAGDAGESAVAPPAPSPRRYTRALACAGLLLALVACAVALLGSSSSPQGWAAATRLTARVSALFFLAAFSASPLAQLWRGPATVWLLRERRGLGLGFCAAHLVHLGAVTGLAMGGEAPGPVAMLGGGLAYLWMLAMALTSTDRAVQRVGVRRWRALHGAGMYYLWGVFTLSYLGRVMREQVPFEHALLFTLLLYVLLLRIYQRVHRAR